MLSEMNNQIAFSPFRLGELQLKNRFIKTATNEGMVREGFPLPALREFHARQAWGGVAMTTVAYGAVSPDGRTMPGQMYMRPEVVPSLHELTTGVHAAGAAASLQLTHCGYFSKNTSISGRRPLAPSRRFNEYGALSGLVCARAMDERDISRVTADFARSAQLAHDSGFDAVEIHMGHGYLLSQFLSPRTNRRTDRYGGSLANRARFALEVLESVKQATGGNLPVLCKINLSDDIRGGLTLDDSIDFAGMLQVAGADALVMSGGFTSMSPFYLMRGDVPLWNMVKSEKEWAQKIAMAMFGPVIIRKYPFKENFFLTMAKKIRDAVTMPLVYLGGVISSAGIDQIMQDGFDLVAIGRALIHDPGFIKKVMADPGFVSGCTHCNLCVAEMERNGIRCPVNPQE